MKKLGAIKNLDAFRASLASGIDVNQTWCGRPVIEYYFTECMRYINGYRNDENCFLQFSMLIEAEADVLPLFQTVYAQYDLKNLMEILYLELEIFSITLSGMKKIPDIEFPFAKERMRLKSELEAWIQNIILTDEKYMNKNLKT